MIEESNILITGGTGLVGKHLVKRFRDKGLKIRLLTSNKSKKDIENEIFYWKPESGIIDQAAFKNVNTIINLSGASIAGGLWTKRRKALIYSSRVEATALLHQTFKSTGQMLKSYFGASAIGFYGPNNTNSLKIENDPCGDDFLSTVCDDWERAHHKFHDCSENVFIGRFSNILAHDGGMLEPFIKMSKLRLRVNLTNGKQSVAWVYISDVVDIIESAIDKGIGGTFNIAADCLPWGEFQSRIFQTLGEQVIRVTIPRRVLEIILGEISTLFVNGNAVSGSALNREGLEIKFKDLDVCLGEIKKNLHSSF